MNAVFEAPLAPSPLCQERDDEGHRCVMLAGRVHHLQDEEGWIGHLFECEEWWIEDEEWRLGGWPEEWLVAL